MGADGTQEYRVIPWSTEAYAFLLGYASKIDRPFTAADVRGAAYRMGLPNPPTEHAWGGVFKRAAHRGNIVPIHKYADRSKIKWRAFQQDLAGR